MNNTEALATYRRTLNLDGYCPGFNLWTVAANDGNTYLIDTDDEASVSTALYLRSNGKLETESVLYAGINEDANEWKRYRKIH